MREKSKKTVRTRLLAILLVFCMTFQMVAYSPGNVVRAEGEETGVSEALDDEGLSLPENTPENDPGDAIVEPETEVIEKETVQPTDWTVQTEGLKLTLAGISCQKGDEEPADLETVENRWDLSALNPEDAGQLILTWQYAFAEDVALNRGDSFSISMPKTAEGKAFIELKDTEAPAALTDSQDNEIGSYTIKENTATVTLNEAAAESAEAVSGTLELSGTLNAEALKTGEATDATLAPQGEAGEQWTLVLPGKEAAEAAPAPAPTAEPEQKKENPVMNGLKALFGVQERAAMPEGPKDVTDETDNLKLDIAYIDYISPDGITQSFSPKGTPPTIDMSNVKYEAGGYFNMGVNFKFLDLKPGDTNRPIKGSDYFIYDISKYFDINDENIIDKDQTLAQGGTPIANYKITRKAGGGYELRVTFTDIVANGNYTTIEGNIAVGLQLADRGNDNGNPVTIPLDIQGTPNPDSVITLPPRTPLIDGITKSGNYDPETGEAVWQISVATAEKSAGASLAGVKIIEKFPAGLTLSDTVSGTLEDGTPVDFAKQPDGTYTFTFWGTDNDKTASKAPSTITVRTKVADSVYEQLNNNTGVASTTLTNDVEMAAADGAGINLGKNHTASAPAIIHKSGIEKHGVQIGSDTIKWYITINDTGDGNPRNNIYQAIVTDELSTGLKFNPATDSSTVKITNIDTNEVLTFTYWDGSATEPEGNYYTYTTPAPSDESGKIIWHFKDPETLKHAYQIEFDTKVDLPDKDVDYNPDNIPETLKNKAYMTASWPHGEKPGLPINYGFGPIGSDFNVAYVDKSAQADQVTGLIDWTIHPSTHLPSEHLNNASDKAVLTDEITTQDQEFQTGTLKVCDKDNKELKEADGVKIEEPSLNSNQFTITITGQSLKKLNELTIKYQTKAKNYFKENYANHKYTNTVDLAVYDGGTVFNSTDSTEVTFPNNFLKKSTAYDDNSETMIYTILVNDSKMKMDNLSVTDDLKNLKTTVTKGDGTKTEITGLSNSGTDIWTVEIPTTIKVDGADKGLTDAGVTLKNEAGTITLDKTGETSSSYQFDIKLKLTEDAKKKYLGAADCTVSTLNTVTAKTPPFNGGNDFSVTSVGNGQGQTIENKLADKKNLNIKDGKYDWQININPNAVQLVKEDGNNATTAVIQDTIPAGMEFDIATLVLEKKENGTYKPVSLDRTKDIAIKMEGGSTVLQITLPDTKAAYQLKYSTNIVAPISSGKVTNKAELIVDGKTSSSSSQESSADRSSWAHLEGFASYTFVKYDATAGTTFPLQNAKFGLYTDNGCSTLKNIYVSDENGKVQFFGLKPGETYYAKELEAPQGYKLDATIKEVSIEADKGGQTVVSEPVKNDRNAGGVMEIVKQFKKADESGNFESSLNLQSTFELYLYPFAEKGDTQKETKVFVTENNGSYTYAGTEMGGMSDNNVAIKNATGGSLKIEGLPWGTYKLVETEAAGGFVTDKTERKFVVTEVPAVGNTSTFKTEYKDGFILSSDKLNPIINGSTKIFIQKKNEKDQFLPGAKLAIATEDESKIVENPIDSTKYVWDSENQAEEITNLPAGTYYLCEIAAPGSVTTVGKANAIQFTLKQDGKLATGNGITEDTITMVDKTNKITVKKLDQLGIRVAGATIELQEKANDSSYAVPDDHKGDNVSGNELWIRATAANNDLVFEGLQRDKEYKIVETGTVPSGYLEANEINFTMGDDGSVTVTDLGNSSIQSAPDEYKNANSGTTFTLRDERILGHAAFQKLGVNEATTPDTSKGLNGVEFDLYQKVTSGTDVKVNATSIKSKNVGDADGTVSTKACTDIGNNLIPGKKLSDGLPEGTYYFVETKTHDDYEQPDSAAEVNEFTVDKNNRYTWKQIDGNLPENVLSLSEVKNNALQCDVTFIKTDADNNNAVNGAVYGLYTNVDCAEGHLAVGGPSHNTKRTATTLAKDAEIQWTDSNNITYTHKMEKDGQAWFCDVARGEYWIKEITPAPGYTLNDTAIGPFTIDNKSKGKMIDLNTASPSIGGVANKKITNQKNKITIQKMGNANTALSGAVLQLTGKFVKNDGTRDTTSTTIEWTSDANQSWELTGKLIADEIYTLTEQIPPAGYEKAAEVKLKVNAKGALSASTDGGTNWNVVNNNQYQLSDTPVEVSFDKKDQFSQFVSGAELAIYKLDASNNPEGSAIETWTTDRKSHEISAKLSVDQKYRLTEKTTPAGYTTAASIDFTITDDGKINNQTGGNLSNNSETLTMTDKRIMAHVQLTKTDTSRNPIGGMQFTLYKQKDTDPDISDGDNGDTQIASFTLGTSGIWKSQEQTAADNGDTGQKLNEGLSVGKYYFLETNATDSYYLPTNVKDRVTAFDVTEIEDTTTIKKTVENAPMTAAVTLKKVDAENPAASIQDAQFTLMRTKDGKGSTVTETDKIVRSGSDGIIKAESLIKGHYILKETTAPEGYDLGTAPFECEFDVTDAAQGKTLTIAKNAANDDAFSLSITKNQSAVIAEGVANTRKPATFTLEKIDSQNSSTKLNGAKFELYTKTTEDFATDNGKKLVLTAETGKAYDCSQTNPTGTQGIDGRLVLNNLPWGDYWIIETVPPAGYQLPADNSAKSFTVDATALDIQWVSDAAIKNGQNSLTLKKTDINGSALSGATLKITDNENKEVGKATLDVNGDTWTLTGALTADTEYFLYEETIPNGYETPALKNSDNNYLAKIVMSADGKISVEEDNTQTGLVTLGDDFTSLTIKNQPIEVTLNKTDMDGNALTDAEFKVEGTFVGNSTEPIVITDTNKSTALTAKLIAGNTYTVTETTPPKGYKKAAPFDFTVNANGTVTLSDSSGSYVSATQNDQTNTASQITVKDDLVKTRIKKTDEAGQPIDGAQFTITGKFKKDPETEKTQVVSPTATDAAEILNLIESSSKGNPDHIYTLEETRAADGYQRVTEKAEFFICPQAKVHFKPESGISGVTSTDSDEITMTFKDKPIKLGLNKTDENGAALAGVTFNLTGKFADNPSTEATKELTSTDGAYHLDKILIAGESYTLKETAAPPKYQIYENGVKIQVSDDGKNITIEGNHDGISLENNILTFKDKLKLGNIVFDKKAIDSEDDTEASPRDRVTFGLYTDLECKNPVTKNEDGQSVAVTAVSGQNGKVQFTDIPAGVYYIKEMGTDPVNAYYKTNNRVYKADVDGSQQANTGGAYGITLADNTAIDNTVINTAVRGDIILKKIDDTFKTTDANGNETGLALSGAQFAVCLKGTKTVAAGITEKAETPGEYALQPVTQITLGDGYTIKLQNDFNIPYLYDNKLLAGEYDIYETAAPGGYIAPDNIVAELHIAEMITTIGGEAATQAIITNQIRRSAVTVEKQIETTAQGSIEVKTAKAGAGYQFRLERVTEADGKTPARFGYTATAATKDNGKAEFENVPVGQYQITETAVSGLTEPYVLPGSQAITVREDGSVDNGGKQNQFTNTLKRGSITGVKTDTDTRADKTYPVKGAVIGLFKDGQNIAEATTGENGTYRFDNIPYGSYTLKEIAAPAGYVLNDTQTIDVKVTENGQEVKASAAIANTLMKGSLTLLKTNTDSQKLSDAEFTLTGKNNYGDDITPIVKITGADGLAVFENLPLGSYTLTETRQPDGYERLDESLDVSVTAGSNNIAQVGVSQNGEAMKPDSDSQYALVNKAAEIVFNKTGHIGELCANGENAGDYLNATKPLEGAKFGLYTQDNQLVKEAVSNEGGQVVFDHVTPGTYLVKELEAPHCYKVDANAYLAVVDETGRFNGLKAADGSSLKDNTILNDAVRGKIKLVKVDEQNPDKRLPGSTYGLYKRVEKQSRNPFARFFRAAPQYDEILIATGVTDENGEILFDGLLTGVEYTVKELAAPAGSQVSEKPIVVKFKLEEGETEPIVEKSDNGSGTADVDKDGNIIWYEPPIMVEVSKKDTNEKMLSGAKLRITEDENKDGIFEPVKDENGDALEWLSSSEPERIANLLKADIDYRLEEIESPAGYTLAEPIDFNVTVKNVGPDENFVDKITMTDTLTALSISKTAINGTDELPGAVLTVYEAAEDGSIARDEAGNEIVAQTITGESLSWTSGTEMKKIEGLKKGTYILREITAPDGYEVAEEITFTLMPDGTVAVGGKACEGNIVRMQDKPVAENGTPGVPDKPQTAAPNNPDVNSGAATGIAGSVSPTTFWGVLALLSVAALLVCSIVVWRRKRW